MATRIRENLHDEPWLFYPTTRLKKDRSHEFLDVAAQTPQAFASRATREFEVEFPGSR